MKYTAPESLKTTNKLAILIDMKVFITRRIMPFGHELLQKAGIEFTEWTENRNPTAEELAENCRGKDGLLSAGLNKLDEDFFSQSPDLKVVSLHSVGYDHVDLKAAAKYNVRIGNTPEVLNKATADIAFLLMLSVSRRAFDQYKRISDSNWGFLQPDDELGIELHGKTLGVFGLGKIGFEMAKRSQNAFGMKIIYHNRSRNEEAEKELGAEYVSFDGLLEKSDVISVHANLSKETTGIFNASAFDRMKPSAIFVNAARGGLHIEEDLIEALKDNKIWGAGLDVTNPEPMSAENPLLNMPRVCVTPHIGSATEETRAAMLKLAIENLIAGVKGEKMPAEVK